MEIKLEFFFNMLVTLVKLPFTVIFKTIITILNLIPLGVYEIHGIRGNSDSNRPDLRELHIQIKGKRRVHLGSFFIAWARGAVFIAHLNTNGTTCYGVYTEDYQDIQKKWVW